MQESIVFLLRVQCRRKESSRSLSHLLMSFLFIEAASSFKCSLDNAKRSFYRSFNSIFGRVGRLPSNEVIIQLLKSKCLHVLHYGIEACPLHKSQLKSLDFAVNSALRKIFDTKSQNIVKECWEIFNRLSTESTIASRRWKFLEKITVSQNKLPRYAAYFLSMTQRNFLRYDNRGGRTQLSDIRQTKIFQHNNYCNIDAISRHCWTVSVCFFSFTFSLFCIHLPCDRWIKIMNIWLKSVANKHH